MVLFQRKILRVALGYERAPFLVEIHKHLESLIEQSYLENLKPFGCLMQKCLQWSSYYSPRFCRHQGSQMELWYQSTKLCRKIVQVEIHSFKDALAKYAKDASRDLGYDCFLRGCFLLSFNKVPWLEIKLWLPLLANRLFLNWQCLSVGVSFTLLKLLRISCESFCFWLVWFILIDFHSTWYTSYWKICSVTSCVTPTFALFCTVLRNITSFNFFKLCLIIILLRGSIRILLHFIIIIGSCSELITSRCNTTCNALTSDRLIPRWNLWLCFPTRW